MAVSSALMRNIFAGENAVGAIIRARTEVCRTGQNVLLGEKINEKRRR